MYIFGVGLGCFRAAGDPREPREKYTTNGNKGNLNNSIFWGRGEGCTSVPVVSINSPVRAHIMVLENDWYTGTVVSEEWESDNRASVFWGMAPAVQNPCVS